MSTFSLSILSPRGKAFEGDVDMIVAPGREGDFGVLAGHASMIAALRRGIGRVTIGESAHYYVLGKGILEVSCEGTNVLVDIAERAPSLEEARKILKDFESALAAPTTQR